MLSSVKVISLIAAFFWFCFSEPAYSQTRFIPEAYAWENLDGWQRVTVSYESGSQTLSGRMGHGALQAIWFPATLGGMVGREIADFAGLTEGMGDPTMGEREIMAGIGIAGDIMGATGIRVLGALPLTRAPGSLTLPESAYVGGQRALRMVRSLAGRQGGGNALVKHLLKEGELSFVNELGWGSGAWEMIVKHGDVEAGRFPYWTDSPEPGMVQFGHMKVDPAYQGGGIYTQAMQRVFESAGNRSISSTIQNIPTVNYMRGAQRLGLDMSRVFRYSPLGRARAAWGLTEHFVTNWRTTSIRDVPTTQFDVFSFKPGAHSFFPPSTGLPGIPSQIPAILGGGFSGCQGWVCKPK